MHYGYISTIWTITNIFPQYYADTVRIIPHPTTDSELTTKPFRVEGRQITSKFNLVSLKISKVYFYLLKVYENQMQKLDNYDIRSLNAKTKPLKDSQNENSKIWIRD